ncbi:MAG: FAD binding domain-containing protein [Thermodesulfobacteriota bacterium]|nr:FAD binding domain-containing protein [Thermodesulfobacteriota bacterium]
MFSPKAVTRAVALQKDDGKFLAGGTDLLVAMKQRIEGPGLRINLDTISLLKKIKRDKKNGLRGGGSATLTQIKEDPIIRRRLPVLMAKKAHTGIPPYPKLRVPFSNNG